MNNVKRASDLVGVSKFDWKMEYCRELGLPPGDEWAWAMAEIDYLKAVKDAADERQEGAE